MSSMREHLIGATSLMFCRPVPFRSDRFFIFAGVVRRQTRGDEVATAGHQERQGVGLFPHTHGQVLAFTIECVENLL